SLSRNEEAAAAYTAALALAPDFPPALRALGSTRVRQGRHGEAAALAMRVRALTPNDPAAAALHANALLGAGDYAGALVQFGAAPDMPGRSERDRALHSSAIAGIRTHAEDMNAPALAAVHREWDARHGLPRRVLWRPHDNDRTADAGQPGRRRLRVGYVS